MGRVLPWLNAWANGHDAATAFADNPHLQDSRTSFDESDRPESCQNTDLVPLLHDIQHKLADTREALEMYRIAKTDGARMMDEVMRQPTDALGKTKKWEHVGELMRQLAYRQEVTNHWFAEIARHQHMNQAAMLKEMKASDHLNSNLGNFQDVRQKIWEAVEALKPLASSMTTEALPNSSSLVVNPDGQTYWTKLPDSEAGLPLHNGFFPNAAPSASLAPAAQ
mmetsp:Transcript_62020/g.115108  ORF Transcript_62020/g.115108 Transcript_62020/m.115108 type:complete len:223 (-) Transcript_62020:40-708(-)